MFRLCNLFKLGNFITDLYQDLTGQLYVSTDSDTLIDHQHSTSSLKLIKLMDDSKMNNLKCIDVSGLPDGATLVRDIGQKLIILSADSKSLVITK
jgi:hypothetical protein